MKKIDQLLNKYTMYKVILYGLFALAGVAIISGFIGLIGYSGLSLGISLASFILLCQIINTALSKATKAPTGVESAAITGLILFFLFAPSQNIQQMIVPVLASGIAMLSKYIFAIHKKHIFNPAAIAAVVLGFWPSTSAVWWVGSTILLIPTIIVGFLVVRKIRRAPLVIAFTLSALFVSILKGNEVTTIFTSWPLIFLGTIMLTEPLTTPSSKREQIKYGIIVGGLFSSLLKIGPIFMTPETALIIGNIFSYIVGPKQKFTLKLRSKEEAALNTYHLVFESDQIPKFLAGQYLEWTLPHEKIDNRGNRRYFTIASSPTEKNMQLGVRQSRAPSTFKQTLFNLNVGDTIVANHVTGDFVLPKDSTKKIVWIAGGIGVTPFRSQLKYLIDTQDKRDIQMFYANRTPQEIAYKSFFDKAVDEYGLKLQYIVELQPPETDNWTGLVGFLNKDIMTKTVPDFAQRIFYLSGPNIMVESYKKMLFEMGVQKNNIVTDYFPGF